MRLRGLSDRVKDLRPRVGVITMGGGFKVQLGICEKESPVKAFEIYPPHCGRV